MSNNNWDGGCSWYEPLYRQSGASSQPGGPQQTVRPPQKPRKNRKKTIHIVAICVLVVLLIVGTSFAFRDRGGGIHIEHFSRDDGGDWKIEQWDSDMEKLPDDFNDFFRGFYKAEPKSETAKTDIPRGDAPKGFRAELMPAAEEELSLQELYKKCSPSIVAISGYKDGQVGYNWGTGVIISEDGLILTNTHVIEGCSKATVTLSDDREFEAKLVGADGISDIALLVIDAKGLPAAELGDSTGLQVGDSVAAIGNPLGEEFRLTMTDGIISAIERGVNFEGHSMTLLQTNTAINEGNSGGPLFNMYGQVIGVTNMKMMSSYSSIEGIGFAIPTTTVKNVVNALAEDGAVTGRPSLGITVGAIPDDIREHYELPKGLYVSAVSEGSDAEAEGIKAGDILTHVNGEQVETTDDILKVKDKLGVGDSMDMTVWRDGESFTVSVELMDTNDIYG